MLPYALPAGTRWPITGGVASRVTSSGDQGKKMNILLTGHKTGIIQVWDASSPTIQHICTVEAQVIRNNHIPMSVECISGPSHSDCVMRDPFAEKCVVYAHSDLYTAEQGQSSSSYCNGFLWRIWITGSR